MLHHKILAIAKLSILFLICVVMFGMLLLFIRGKSGNPIYYQKEYDTQVGGPYEGSNSTSRYALTEAIVKNHSLFLSKDQALFASPDVSEYSGKFFSLFTPGVSFAAVPFYLLGNFFSMPQLFSYAFVLLVSVINVFLIARVAFKLGASYFASILSGLIFLFATNGLIYSQTFTQHQPSVLLLLLGLLNVLEERTLLNNIIFGGLFGVGILVDIPNIILMFPFGLYILYRSFQKTELSDAVKVKFKLSIIGVLIGLVPFLMLFGWYNYKTTGSYTKIAQTIGRTDYFSKQTQQIPQRAIAPEKTSKQPAKLGLSLPFQTRAQLNGLYILLLSDERSWIYYSPIVFIGILGWFAAYKKKKTKVIVLLSVSVVVINIILYSMFGDPWGGWAFGPRYLIPATAFLTTGIGIAVTRFKKNYLFGPIFAVLLLYSLWVNNIGALTTAEIPPKVEAVASIPYTYAYNIELLQKNFSSSLFYNLFLTRTITIYWFSKILTISSFLALCGLYIGSYFEDKKEDSL